MQDYEFETTDQVVSFCGTRIGFASSEAYIRSDPTRDKVRWHETHIYILDNGKYVVVKVGNSAEPDDEIYNTVHVADDPRGAAESLYTSDHLRSTFLTRTAKEAAAEASLADPAFARAYKYRNLSAS